MPHSLRNLFKHISQSKDEERELDRLNRDRIVKSAECEISQCLNFFKTSEKGLSSNEARRRLIKYGRNEVMEEKKRHWFLILVKNFKDPLSILLSLLAIISFLTGDLRAAFLIAIMIILSILLRFLQEIKADSAARKLKAMVRTVARVLRDKKIIKLPFHALVPGDIIHLAAGDMAPADVRLLYSKDLYINQAVLTGESIPTEKHAEIAAVKTNNPLELQNICFLGTNAQSGTAIAVVIATGAQTYLGAIARSLKTEPQASSFEIGIKKFTWLIMKFILVMVPVVFLLNGIFKGTWFEAFLFALAVAVGLAPEMLPMIVTVNLSKGAVEMAKKKVIVKHLDAIQNTGAIDVLCTDKTGTITEGRVVLLKHLDLAGKENEKIIDFAFLNSYFQTGLNNLLDEAVLKHKKAQKEFKIKNYKKIDEIPFDFARRRMSVIVQNDGSNILICKGALEEVMAKCSQVEVGGKIISIGAAHHRYKEEIEYQLNSEGFRVVAVAYKTLPAINKRYGENDENDLILSGFLAFLDPPKASAKSAIQSLNKNGVEVKILTGDNELVTEQICAEVGLPTSKILLGNEVEEMTDKELETEADKHQIFAKLTPLHKERIVLALRRAGHTVGFLGDGINDAPALRSADVGISVNSATDIAKESSDLILLEKSLLVLQDGVLEGRRIFANITKYIQMAASSNFGNMFSVLGASIFLPFLPMLPLQILLNNLFYDLSQSTIPTDAVDKEYLSKPRRWEIKHIQRFILFIGPISSLFDYATYFIMLFVFNAWASPALFHTGWFVESLISQTLIIHIIRTNKIPFFQSRASWPLTLSTLGVVAVGAYLPYSPFATYLGFKPLPTLYWFLLIAMMIAYGLITQLVKRWFVKRY